MVVLLALDPNFPWLKKIKLKRKLEIAIEGKIDSHTHIYPLPPIPQTLRLLSLATLS